MKVYVCIAGMMVGSVVAQQAEAEKPAGIKGGQGVVVTYNELQLSKTKYVQFRKAHTKAVIAANPAADEVQVSQMVAKALDNDQAVTALNGKVLRQEGMLDGAVLAEAKKVTQLLAKEVLKGNFGYAVQNMYRRWKARQAKLVGGEQVLVAKFNRMFEEMKRSITITGYRVGQPTKVYRVWPKKLPGVVNAETDREVYFERLAIVPVTMRLRIIDPNQGKIRKFDRHTYQIAVYQPKENQWSFLDGSTLDVKGLREIFPSLPMDISKHLPKIHAVDIDPPK